MLTTNYYKQTKLCYETGNYKQSAELFENAANKGDADAMFYWGIIKSCTQEDIDADEAVYTEDLTNA